MAAPFDQQADGAHTWELEEHQAELPDRKLYIGFDCEFVEPPQEIDAYCPICLLVLREPHQVTCCGKSYCRSCIEQVELLKNPCPTCNEQKFSFFADKRLKQVLYTFRVRCSHEKQGCQWTGELGELDKHLNVSPKLHEQLVGCQFTEVECLHCCDPFQRRCVTAHQIEECIRRPFSCDYCGSYEADFEDVATKHWPVCGSYPVLCPNECGVYPERQNLEYHVHNDCFLTEVSCDYCYAGCKVQLSRKDMSAHLAEDMANHITLIATHSQRKMTEKDEQIAELKEEVAQTIERKSLELGVNFTRKLQQQLQETEDRMTRQHERELRNQLQKTEDRMVRQHSLEMAKMQNEIRDGGMKIIVILLMVMAAITVPNVNFLKKKLEEITSNLEDTVQRQVQFSTILAKRGTTPFEIIMPEFLKHKAAGDIWYSKPFYTHQRGYKLCLAVHANGQGDANGKGILVFIHLMRGKYDDELVWPLQGNTTVYLLNQFKDEGHHKMLVLFAQKGNRVVETDRAANGVGNTFISHRDLSYMYNTHSQYLKNDCLRFRVDYVKAGVDTVAVVPLDIIMTDFERRKKDSEEWFSEPFYTHPGGYKMCLRVDASGVGYGTGTHVSVFVVLMQSKYDYQLKWPFRGDITIQLLNLKSDKKHWEKTIPFDDNVGQRADARVVGQEMGTSGWGESPFIAHTKLNTEDKEYLKENCLKFRVPKIVVKSI